MGSGGGRSWKTGNAGSRNLPPLPKALGDHVSRVMTSDLPLDANAGLVYWRYAKAWDAHHSPLKSKENTVFMRAFAQGFRAQRGRHERGLDALRTRLDGLGEGRDFKPTGPVVTGLGADHPSENGFAFHPLLGVPWLSGSTVKGAVRAGARLLEGGDSAMVLRLLGHGPKPDRYYDMGAREASLSTARQGAVAFLGALPTRWPELAVDLVNPHTPRYYADQAKAPESLKKKGGRKGRIASPVENPIPSPFLVVAPMVSFRFWIRPVARVEFTPEDRLYVWQWLEAGLAYLGVGAKTAAGYGHMVPAK